MRRRKKWAGFLLWSLFVAFGVNVFDRTAAWRLQSHRTQSTAIKVTSNHSQVAKTQSSYVQLRPCWKQGVSRVQEPCLAHLCNNREKLNRKHDTKAVRLLTIALLYYEDAMYLQRHLNSWIKLSAETLSKVTFAIVDDGSTFHSAADTIRALSDTLERIPRLEIALLRIHQDLPWNIGGARNLVASTVATRYFFLMDADIMFPNEFFEFLFELMLSAEEFRIKTGIETVFTSFPRKMGNLSNPIDKPHPALMLISTKAYWAAGGCDEDFVGHYGSTDPHFRWRLSHTQNVRKIEVSKAYTHAPILTQIKEEGGKRLERNKTHNSILFEKKRLGAASWSCTYLRFNWSFVSW